MENTDQVDLWPFFTVCPVVDFLSWASSEAVRHLISVQISAAREICGSTTTSYQVVQYKDIEVSNQAVFFHYLMPEIPQWFANTNLLGRYAMTEERYVVALLRASRYIMRLPKDQLAVVVNDKATKFSASMLLAQKTFSSCMDHVPQSIELYFFVLFMCSVFAGHLEEGWDRQSDSTCTKSAKKYLLLVSTP